MLLSNLGAFIGYISFGYIADLSERFKMTFSLYALLFTLGAGIFIIGTALDVAVLSLSGIFAVGVGTGFFSGFGPLYSRIFATKVRNTCSSFCFNAGRLGAFVAPILVSQLALLFGIAGGMSTAIIFSLLVAIWIFFVPIPDDAKAALETDY